MKKPNYLSRNLNAYREIFNKTYVEFSEELNIPKSTLQSIIQNGNTTLDTLLILEAELGVSLDELVHGEMLARKYDFVKGILFKTEWYPKLTPSQMEEVCYCMDRLLVLAELDNA